MDNEDTRDEGKKVGTKSKGSLTFETIGARDQNEDDEKLKSKSFAELMQDAAITQEALKNQLHKIDNKALGPMSSLLDLEKRQGLLDEEAAILNYAKKRQEKDFTFAQNKLYNDKGKFENEKTEVYRNGKIEGIDKGKASVREEMTPLLEKKTAEAEKLGKRALLWKIIAIAMTCGIGISMNLLAFAKKNPRFIWVGCGIFLVCIAMVFVPSRKMKESPHSDDDKTFD